jgi:hypothetical protein
MAEVAAASAPAPEVPAETAVTDPAPRKVRLGGVLDAYA